MDKLNAIEYNNHLFNQDSMTTITIIIAIIYVSVIYICFGILVTYEMDKNVFFYVEKDFSQESVIEQPIYLLILNIMITFSIISVVAYIIRNIVQNIPFPFNFDGIDYHKIREVYTGAVMIIIMVAFSQTLDKQYKEIKYKLNGRIY